MSRRVRQWQDWDIFAQHALPAIQQLATTLQHTPNHGDMQRAKLWWILSAANRHFGSYSEVLHRLGLVPPPRSRRKDWISFQRQALPVLQQFRTKLNRTPWTTELEEAGYSWLVVAAGQYHGGYHHILTKLGLPLPPPRRQDRGNWDSFQAEAKPIIQNMAAELKRTPFSTEVRAAGHVWLVCAAIRHHDGYHATIERLGFPIPRKPRTYVRKRRVRQTSISPRWRYWTRRDVQLKILRQHFGESLSWGTMPSSIEVAKRFSGLAVHWIRQPGGWRAAAASFGLLSPTEGRHQRLVYQAVDAALQFYEQHHRWPKSSECTSSLRNYRFNFGRGWERFFTIKGFHPLTMDRLVQRWRQHWQWSQRHADPAHRAFALRMMNQAVIKRNGKTHTA